MNISALQSAPPEQVQAGETYFFGAGGCSGCHMVRGRGASLDFSIPFDPKAARAMAVSGKALPSAETASRAAAEMRRIAVRLSGREAMAKKGLKRWFG